MSEARNQENHGLSLLAVYPGILFGLLSDLEYAGDMLFRIFGFFPCTHHYSPEINILHNNIFFMLFLY
jgi:hypothetical protein